MQPSANSSANSGTSQLWWQENDLPRSRVQKSQTFKINFPKSGIRKSTHQPHSAGLLEDCRYALFYNDTEISLFDLGDLQKNPIPTPAFPRTFNKQYKDECVFNVALSARILFVVTNRRMITIDITKELKDSEIDSTSYGADWDPSGLACYESSGQIVVLLGQCRGNQKRGFQGQVKVFKCKVDSRAKLKYCSTISLLDPDWPKILCHEAKENILTCVTGIQNKLLAWKLEDDLSGSTEILNFQKNKYAAVSANPHVS